jgi:hypothetical protein
VTWATRFGDDWERAWNECPRGDWLLAIAARAGVDRKKLVLAAAASARTALDSLPPGENRPLSAIEAAERWASGSGSEEECEKSARSLNGIVFSDPASAASNAAAHAAALSVRDPDAASVAASNAAQAAIHGVDDCAMMALLSYAHRTCADHVRAHVDFATLSRARATKTDR